MKKNLFLTFASIASLTVFFLLPANRQWINNKPLGYWNDFRKQRTKLDIEHRKIKRWENDYVLSRQIGNHFIKSASITKVLVLVPPSTYFKEKKIDYHVPEPAVFYYYTGLKTVWVDSKMAMEANWIATAKQGQLELIPVSDKKMLQDSIEAFRKFPVSL